MRVKAVLRSGLQKAAKTGGSKTSMDRAAPIRSGKAGSSASASRAAQRRKYSSVVKTTRCRLHRSPGKPARRRTFIGRKPMSVNRIFQPG